MFTQFEEKGKIFTNVISKNPVNVIIQTTTHQIRAKYHVRPGDRMKDEMNSPEYFIALTDAVIFDFEGKQIFSSNFLAVNKSTIVWIIPDEELERSGD